MRCRVKCVADEAPGERGCGERVQARLPELPRGQRPEIRFFMCALLTKVSSVDLICGCP